MEVFENNSYPTHETPISTPEGPSTINAEERRRREKKKEEEEQMKNADLINFYNFLYYLFKKFTKNQKKKTKTLS